MRAQTSASSDPLWGSCLDWKSMHHGLHLEAVRLCHRQRTVVGFRRNSLWNGKLVIVWYCQILWYNSPKTTFGKDYDYPRVVWPLCLPYALTCCQSRVCNTYISWEVIGPMYSFISNSESYFPDAILLSARQTSQHIIIDVTDREVFERYDDYRLRWRSTNIEVSNWFC